MSSSNREVLSLVVKFDGDTAISGDNGSVETKDGDHILRFQVDQRLDSPDFFSLDLQMLSEVDFMVLDKVKPGMAIEILAGYDTEATLFKGEVSYVEPFFPADAAEFVRVSGYDKSHRLTRGTSSRTWGDGVEANDEVGAIAGQVVSGSKARKGNTSDSLSAETDTISTKLEYLPQVEVNDYQFIRGLGLGAALTIDSKSADDAAKLGFKKVTITGSPKVTICREHPEPTDARQVLDASFCLSTVKQVARVEVRGWNPKEKQPILGVAEAVSEAFAGTTGPAAAGKAHYGSSSSGRVLTIVDQPVASTEEAELIAASVLDQLAMDFVTADVEIEGVPELMAGDVVELKQFGKVYSGTYLAESVQHVYSAAGEMPYVCRIKLARNAAPEG